jgi:nucleoid DNA-binding protein
MKIEVFLSELLYEHDCVVIPQFGGLVANYRHAKLNELNHTIYPPSKQLAFNRNLLQNDGLLYKHVSDMLGLGYTEAKNEVDEAIKSLKNKLLKGEKVVLERIGVFFPDRKGSRSIYSLRSGKLPCCNPTDCHPFSWFHWRKPLR